MLDRIARPLELVETQEFGQQWGPLPVVARLALTMAVLALDLLLFVMPEQEWPANLLLHLAAAMNVSVFP